MAYFIVWPILSYSLFYCMANFIVWPILSYGLFTVRWAVHASVFNNVSILIIYWIFKYLIDSQHLIDLGSLINIVFFMQNVHFFNKIQGIGRDWLFKCCLKIIIYSICLYIYIELYKTVLWQSPIIYNLSVVLAKLSFKMLDLIADCI